MLRGRIGNGVTDSPLLGQRIPRCNVFLGALFRSYYPDSDPLSSSSRCWDRIRANETGRAICPRENNKSQKSADRRCQIGSPAVNASLISRGVKTCRKTAAWLSIEEI